MTIQWCNVTSKYGRFNCSLTSRYAFCGTFCVGFFWVIYITMVASSAEESHLTHSKLSRTQQYIYCWGFSKLRELQTNKMRPIKGEEINMTNHPLFIAQQAHYNFEMTNITCQLYFKLDVPLSLLEEKLYSSYLPISLFYSMPPLIVL